MIYHIIADAPGSYTDNLPAGFKVYSINVPYKYGTHTPVTPTREQLLEKKIIFDPTSKIDQNEINKKCGLPPVYFVVKPNENLRDILGKMFKITSWLSPSIASVECFEGEFIPKDSN